MIWVALAVMTIDGLRRKPADPIAAGVDLAAPESSSR
jgi:hypothetical protein